MILDPRKIRLATGNEAFAMKLYISADIEGVAGITAWDEANKGGPTYEEFRELMTEEVLAACEGAMEAGATEIWVKDAHGTGRNIILSELPECVRVIRGWSGHPLGMVQEIDESFAAVAFVGFHSRAGSDANPLAHTFTGKFARVTLNGMPASEFLFCAWAAALYEVPAVFISGDELVCLEAREHIRHICTAAVSRGMGPSTVSVAPGLARRQIKEGVYAALKGDTTRCRVDLPDRFVLEITYSTPGDAYRASWYPGMEHPSPLVVCFTTASYFEVLRALRFMGA